MNLDNQTFEKISTLLNIPINTIEYNGVYNGIIDFKVGIKNNTGDWQSGVSIGINENFEIKQVQRITLIQGRFTKNYPVRRFTIPIYSAS